MAIVADLKSFQDLLNRVARTGKREEVDGSSLPHIREWNSLDSQGCIISVERGRWWVLPQR